MEHITEAVDLIQYIKYFKSLDPYYDDKITSKKRQMLYTYNEIRKVHPEFAGLQVIDMFLESFFPKK